MERKHVAGAIVVAFVLVVHAIAYLAFHRTPASGDETRVGEPEWGVRVAEVERALDARDLSTALRALPGAREAALRSHRWDAMLTVGDLTRRLGDLSYPTLAARVGARRAYVVALARARAAESPEGVLRVAEAFAALGDEDFVRAAVQVAGNLAATRDPETRRRTAIESARVLALVTPEETEDTPLWRPDAIRRTAQ